jgi:hypothetical protein
VTPRLMPLNSACALLHAPAQDFVAEGKSKGAADHGDGAVELTGATFDAEIAGKGAFIKFLAPW